MATKHSFAKQPDNCIVRSDGKHAAWRDPVTGEVYCCDHPGLRGNPPFSVVYGRRVPMEFVWADPKDECPRVGSAAKPQVTPGLHG